MQSINLIPQQEVHEQTQQKAVKLSTVASVFILLLVIGVAGFMFYRTTMITRQINTLEGEINTLRGDIQKLSDIEIYARNLDKKFNTLKSIFATRSMYSLLSHEIKARIPAGVVIESITLQKETSLNITGFADNYIAIAAFTNNLLDRQFDTGNAALKTLFKTVTLNSVSLEKSRNQVSYSINVDIDANLLKRK